MLGDPIIAATITTTVGATVTSVGLYIAYRNRQPERVKLTRDLINQYANLTDDRSEAWFWLDRLNREQPIPSFEEIWRNESNKRQFHSLYKVCSFWFLAYHLLTARQLHTKLTLASLGYELYFWSKQLCPVIASTRAKDTPFPQVLEALENTLWLLPENYTPKTQ